MNILHQAADISKHKTPEIIIPHMMRRMLDSHREPYFIKNLDSRTVYANLAMAKLVGLRSPDSIIGRFDHEVQAKLYDNEESIKLWRSQDTGVSDSLKPLTMLEIHRGAVEHPFINKKIPLYNEENECVGVACYIRNLEVFTLNDLLKNRSPGSLILNKPGDFFTEKECDVIFLKLQGLTSKEVGKVLNLSPKTVDNRLNILYTKAGVSHFDDFHEFCRKHKYDCYLPARFFSSKVLSYDGEPVSNKDWLL